MKKNVNFKNNQKEKIKILKETLLKNYNNNIDEFIEIVIKYNAEREVYYENKNNKLTQEELKIRISEKYGKKRRNEFDSFKEVIVELFFLCLLEIFKTKIISFFIEIIMKHVEPKIKQLMSQIKK